MRLRSGILAAGQVQHTRPTLYRVEYLGGDLPVPSTRDASWKVPIASSFRMVQGLHRAMNGAKNC